MRDSDYRGGVQFLRICVYGGDVGDTVGCAGEWPPPQARWVEQHADGKQSVVITAVLSSIFLKERLSFVGKIGCFMCVVGSVVIVMNAPEQTAVNKIQDMQKFVVTPGFLSYMGVVIVGCLFVALWVAPRWGKTNMMVYISICSLIGGLRYVRECCGVVE